jgi:hypothetical protein
MTLRSRTRLAWAAAVALAGALVSGCSGESSQPAAGTIAGTFRLSAGVVSRPDGGAIPGRITATARDGRAFSAAVPSSGRFRLRLPPGWYTLVGSSPRFVSDGAPGRCAAGSVSVTNGRVVTRDVTCLGM